MSSPRWARALVVAAAAVVLLSGCYRLDMHVVVEEDGTASGSYVIAVDRALLEASGQSAEEVFAGGPEGLFGEALGDVEVEDRPYEDGDLVGREILFSGAPLDTFSDEISLTHADGEYALEGVLTAQGDTGMPGAAPDIRITFTFPGDVRETNGTIDPDDPRSVLWTTDGSSDLTVQAVAADTPSAASWVRLAVVGGGALLLLVVLVVVLVLLVRRRRRRVAYVAGYPVYAGIPPVAPGPPAPPAAAWATPAAPATPIAWQPDPPAGMPPGAVPHQPPTGPRQL